MLGVGTFILEFGKTKVTVKTRNDVCLTPVAELSITEVICRIKKLNNQLAQFCSKSDG